MLTQTSMIEPAVSELFLGRQPILDRTQQIVAYELLFRKDMRNYAEVSDNAQATATVIANVFSELSICDALGPCRGFINVDESILFGDVLELLPRQSVVLEILETVKVTPEVVERCRMLRASGFTLALDDVVQLSDEYQPLFELVEVIKVDLPALCREQLPELVAKIRALGLKSLAEKVDSQEQLNYCMELGFDFFQGYFFAEPTIIKGKKLDPSHLTLIRLMNMVLADDDDAEIEKILKHEPGLTLNLLRMTNSVAVGAPVHITSLRQAIAVLGRRQLQRWLQLLLYVAGDGAKASMRVSPLLLLAATRGRLMELLAIKLAPKDSAFADHAFMTGILSLTPVLLNMSIEDIVAQLTLDPDSCRALCAPNQRSGPLGILLTLTEQIESNHDAAVWQTLEHMPGLTPATLNQCLAQALKWANNIGLDV